MEALSKKEVKFTVVTHLQFASRPCAYRRVEYGPEETSMNQIISKKEQSDLILSAKIFRLDADVSLIKQGIEENKEVAKDEKDNIFKKFGKSVSNSVKKSRTENYEKALGKDEAEIVSLGEEGLIKGEDFKAKAKEALDSQAKKAAFGLLYLVSDSFEYDSQETTLSSLSETLYGSKEALSTLSKELDDNFRILSESIFSSLKSNDLVKEAMEGYYASLIRENKEKCALCTAKAILGDESKAAPLLALLLAGKNNLPYCNDEESAKAAFLGIDKDSYFAAIALKATLIQEEKKEWKSEEKDGNLKAILTALSNLNLLAQISYIVDKKEEESAKVKIKSLNAFVNRLNDLTK